MKLYKDKYGRLISIHKNKLRLFPSIYTSPFYSFRWLWFTLVIDMNKVGQNEL